MLDSPYLTLIGRVRFSRHAGGRGPSDNGTGRPQSTPGHHGRTDGRNALAESYLTGARDARGTQHVIGARSDNE